MAVRRCMVLPCASIELSRRQRMRLFRSIEKHHTYHNCSSLKRALGRWQLQFACAARGAACSMFRAALPFAARACTPYPRAAPRHLLPSFDCAVRVVACSDRQRSAARRVAEGTAPRPREAAGTAAPRLSRRVPSTASEVGCCRALGVGSGCGVPAGRGDISSAREVVQSAPTSRRCISGVGLRCGCAECWARGPAVGVDGWRSRQGKTN